MLDKPNNISGSYKKAMDKLKRYQFESDIEASSSDCSRLPRSPLSRNDSHITASPIPRVVSNSNDGMSAKISKLEGKNFNIHYLLFQ